MKYTVVIEKTPNNYAAYVPDLPGCVATAISREELLEEIREAIEFHIEGMREDGDPVPEPQATAAVVDAAVTAAPVGNGGGESLDGADVIDALVLRRVSNLRNSWQ